MFPYDHPYLQLMGKFSQVFGGGGSGVVVAVKVKKGDIFNEKTLTKIKNMTSDVELWDEVYRVLTVSMASNHTKVVKTKGKGEITIESLMFPDVPRTPKEMELLKKNIFSNPAYNGSLISRDGTACLLVTECKENISYSRIFALLRGLEKKYSDENTSIHVVGFPMLMGWIYSLTPQMYMVFGISIFAIALVLWLIFDNFPGMISPLANAGILTIWGLGFIGFTGLNFSPLLYVLAFLVAARMIGNSHQIAYRYFEELDASKGDRKKASYETMRTMWVPNFAAVAADVAGFAVLFLAKIVLMLHLAIIMSFWMATILFTGLLVPLVCSLVPQEVTSKEWAKESCQLDWKARLMMRITHFSIGPRTRYITGALILLLTVFCVWETSKMKIGDPTPGSPVLYDNHPYNKDQAVLNKLFDASSENFVLYYEGSAGSVYEPVVLNTFEAFARHMAERLPDIYKSSTSILNMASIVNRTFHDGDMLWYQLPRDQEMLTGLLGYIRNTVDRGTLGRFMDSTLERAQITLYFADHTSGNLLRIRNAAYDFFKNRPMKIGNGQFHLAGGRIGMEIAVNEEMKRSHLLIDLAVYLGILVLCSLCYKSIVAGLMLTVPLILANSMAATYMSIRDIGLSINTLPIAAIGAGLGVDFAIYLYSRAMEEFPVQNGDWTATIMQSVCTCGKAVVYTGITVILPILTWYFFSDMKFQAEVGFFLSLIMAANVVLTLTLHPLMIYIFKPKFISQAFFDANNSSTIREIGATTELG
ncbi:MAG: MMPL family transporter [Deltaproteobacteria bacterium]|nr:MMPL family transporter [Deltaproteobacteria bacterium]